MNHNIINRCNYVFRLSTKPEHLKHISLGLESTLRHLKKSELKLLVITDELSPRWFAQHLVALALHKNPNTEIMIVKNLKDITKKSLKVSSTVLGVRTGEFEEFLKKLGNHAEFVKHFCEIKTSEDVSLKKRRKNVAEFKEAPVVLLQKRSTSSREFEPMDIDEVNLPTETAGYISFSKFNDSSSNFLSKSTVASYRPIKIKKIVGNAKRKEKKS